MLRSELVAELMMRRDTEVVVQVGNSYVPVDGVKFHPDTDAIVIGLDPVALTDVLTQRTDCP